MDTDDKVARTLRVADGHKVIENDVVADAENESYVGVGETMVDTLKHELNVGAED